MGNKETQNKNKTDNKEVGNSHMEGSEELWRLLTKISHIMLLVAVCLVGFWAYSNFSIGKATSIAFLALSTAWAAYDVRGESDWKKRFKAVFVMLVSYGVGYFALFVD